MTCLLDFDGKQNDNLSICSSDEKGINLIENFIAIILCLYERDSVYILSISPNINIL